MNPSTYIAFLRGINVSGQKSIKMDDLRQFFEIMGFLNVKTYIQSGNVLFTTSDKADKTALANRIEEEVEKEYGFTVSVLIKNSSELKHILENNPFANSPEFSEATQYITMLQDKPDMGQTEQFEKYKSAGEILVFKNSEAYFYCPGGYGRTKLSNTFIESKLKINATTRNLNTMKTLLELALK
jgi:uncharacterized protein (DUF1697 family)